MLQNGPQMGYRLRTSAANVPMREKAPNVASPRPEVGAAGLTERADIVVAGDGIIALAAALALRGALGPQGRIVMAADPPSHGAGSDGRAFAIAASGRHLLGELGIWPALEAEAQPIADIAITDSRLDDVVRPTFLSFAGEPQGEGALAHMVEAQALQNALALKADAARIERLPRRPSAITFAADNVRVSFGAARAVEASLLVAADGGRSFCRETAGIGWIGWGYPQRGLTVTVAHEREHEARAYEHFLPGGPFATLPLKGRRSSIVWAEDEKEAKRLLALGDEHLREEIARRFGHELGELSLEGRVVSYPLSFGVARAFVGQRLALVGDAAHVVHPVAGQGLNLGLRDVAALAEAVAEAALLGLDPGAAHALSTYQRARRFDTTAMGATTDGLVKLFSNDRPALRALRDLGLGIVDRMQPVKRFLVAQARGQAGGQGSGQVSGQAGGPQPRSQLDPTERRRTRPKPLSPMPRSRD
ncbi:2-octaprenyl-6-methoxyphenol hydroxylase /2-octaprenyl-3-methyl-6-methoxy-1,4-benzoquinol hydroxylase [Rhizobiales bacterium GAS191]|nr:2-octaprenyl-6-methoxyphenol hydroxylase /2-octaprenyl-3-methyl-6-methoxy-1,4-benzoquinol hydroxylase [Rhizobiales bacterium GAS113]SEE96468.1 2-octaprenyl-6-methoxyphenol hydroxylase /2-octaprenyl-3-methyl-6-methoxy-1,4-benzoquinol hydroxylase [Rhizobiales bacterium GAS191]